MAGRNTINVTGFARECKCSRQTIYTAIKKKDVIQREDGDIDLDNDTNRQFKINKIGGVSKKPGPEPKPEPVEQTNLDFTLDDLDGVEQFIDFDKAPKNMIDKFRSLEQARGFRIANEQKRGLLISRHLVLNLLNEIYALDCGQFKNMADKMSAEVGAIFENEDPSLLLRVDELLTIEINSTLVLIKDKIEHFIENYGSGS